MKQFTLKSLAIDHDYYCSDNNYYSNEAGINYKSFDDFYDEFKDADVDMNLVFRWDVGKHPASDLSPREGYYLQIFIMKQRKGIFTPIYIETIEDKDVPNLLLYLQPHIQKLKKIWEPFKF